MTVLSKLAGDELLSCCFPVKPVLRRTVSGESADGISELEPFFGTGGANSSISERASRDFAPEICTNEQYQCDAFIAETIQRTRNEIQGSQRRNFTVHWNPVNTATNGPYKFGRISGGRSNFMAGLCAVR